MGELAFDSWDDVAAWLKARRAGVGSPVFAELARRVEQQRADRGDPAGRPPRSTVYDSFRPGRRRMDLALLEDLAVALGVAGAELGDFRRACLAVQDRIDAARVVSVHEQLSTSPHFVGRRGELARLESDPGRVWLVTGMTGVGKTQVALRATERWQHQSRLRRVLVADLRGFHESRPPAHGETLLNELLRLLTGSLGVRSLPAAVRQARLWELLESEQVALVLDDAASARQVTAILGEPPERPIEVPVIVTSRRRDVAVGARVLELRDFDEGESRELLASVVAEERLAADDEATTRLIELSHGHPFTLDLVAHRVADSGWSLADHAEQLRAQTERLQLPTDLEGLLEASTRGLARPADAVLRTLAAQPCSTLSADAVAALAGVPPEEAETALAELDRAGLLTHRAGRCELHDLVRLHSRHRAELLDPASARREALGRLMDYQLTTARRMITSLGAAAQPRVAPDRFEPLPGGPDSGSAQAWLVDERENLLVLAEVGIAEVRPEFLPRLGAALSNWYDTVGWHEDAMTLMRRCRSWARSQGDDTGAAEAAALLGLHLTRVGDPAAGEVLTAALADPALDDHGRINANSAMLLLEVRTGSLNRALDLALETLAIVEEGRVDRPKANLLSNVSALLGRAGRLAEAAAYSERAYAAALAEGDRLMAAIVLGNLSGVLRETGDLEGAVHSAQEGLRLADEEGYVLSVSTTACNLGSALSRLGRHEEAMVAHDRAVASARETGDRNEEASALVERSASLLVAGRVADGRAGYAAALELAAELGDPQELGRSHEGLADAALAEGDLAEGETELAAARAAFAEGDLEADAVRVAERLHGLRAG